MREQENVGLLTIAKTVFGAYPRRTVVGLSLFIGQAFLYNAVFFTYALVLGTFYDVKPASVGWYIIPFAIGNFLGPLILGRLFDSVGRKPMIAGTYILSGVLLIITAFLFKADVWTAQTQTAAWCVIFFFASAGASAAYLTVSEIFPMETRAMAIAFFYAVGTAVGGITRAAAVRQADRDGQGDQRLLGLRPRRVAHDRRGDRPGADRRRGGEARPRGHRGAAVGEGRRGARLRGAAASARARPARPTRPSSSPPRACPTRTSTRRSRRSRARWRTPATTGSAATSSAGA